jgi:N-carbamoylputrescine amidase
MTQADTQPESRIRVACLQMEPHVGDKAGNVRRSLDMLERAATQGAGLAVLPELANSG